ncbi:hypothetical protein CVM39_17365 [Pseudooceanicola antarcticus]|uniref:(2Fe-2S) ferredoxin n=1 Tax=Pseudooceanicola antarcticus TaxID=1247613 RepID=A0ABX4MMG6_9RHOB|nr:hypothetical protein CVM39_17365 [Pseudooceanicola antarcticus]
MLFACSVPNLSTGALRRLQSICAGATTLIHRLIRLEEAGPGLLAALDEMREDGAQDIRVQPIGLPFSESLQSWLPGVLAHWQGEPSNSEIQLSLGPEPARAEAASAIMLAQALEMKPRPLEGVRPALGKPGWQDPPDFDFHLLVCTGPRCHMRDAASLTHVLKAECAEAGISKRCLTTSTGCIFPCNRGPVVAVYPQGHWFHIPDRAAARRLVREVLCEGGTLPEFHFHTARQARISNEGDLS